MRSPASAVRSWPAAIVFLLTLGCNASAFADGPFDPTFGFGGVSFYLDWLSATPYGITQDSQNRLLVAASIGKQLAVSRHEPNGDLDKTFGHNGIASDFVYLSGDDSAWATSVVVDHKGRILIGGGVRSTASCEGGGTFNVRDYVVVRVLNGSGMDGSADLTFGAFGDVIYGDCHLDTQGVRNLAIDSDDSVFAIGTASDSHGVARATIVKWTSEGKLDPSFGRSGVADYTSSTLGETDGMAIAVDANHRVLVTTESYDSGRETGALLRFTPKGELDSTFGIGGIIDFGELTPDIFAHGGGLCCVRVDEKGRVVVAGFKAEPPGDGSGVVQTTTFVARFNDGGVPDESFGHHGFVTIGTEEVAGVFGLAVDGKNRPILSGTVKSPYMAFPATAVFQFNADGTANSAVGFEGVYSAEFGYSVSPTSLLLDAAGNVVLSAADGRTREAMLIRFDQVFGDGFD